MLTVTVYQSWLAFPGHLSLMVGMCRQRAGELREGMSQAWSVLKKSENFCVGLKD